jgi:hypothetical protein
MEYREVITDKRVINAVLRAARKANEKRLGITVPSDTYAYASKWGYIETCGDWRKYDHIIGDFNGVEYKGKLYATKYFDGCFKPFVVEQCPAVYLINVTWKRKDGRASTTYAYETWQKRDIGIKKIMQDFKRRNLDAEFKKCGGWINTGVAANGETVEIRTACAYIQ